MLEANKSSKNKKLKIERKPWGIRFKDEHLEIPWSQIEQILKEEFPRTSLDNLVFREADGGLATLNIYDYADQCSHDDFSTNHSVGMIARVVKRCLANGQKNPRLYFDLTSAQIGALHLKLMWDRK